MEEMQTSITKHAESSNDIVILVKHDPVMQVAVELLQTFSKGKRIILKAKGDAIPNAVAIANIMIESARKDYIKTEEIKVDSEAPPGMGRMISTIEIVLARC